MLCFTSFAHLMIAAMPDAQTAAAIVTLIFSMSLIFNGVMQSPTALPGFWVWMYRIVGLPWPTVDLKSRILTNFQLVTLHLLGRVHGRRPAIRPAYRMCRR